MTEPIDARGLMTDGGVGRYLLDPAAVIGIAIHHSVSGGTFFMSTTPDEDDELSHLIMIDRYHASKGWGGFGYHMAAFPSGRFYLCGALNGARAHVASRNNELVGLVLIGTFTDTPPPASQLVAAASAVAYMRRTYPGRPIGPHRNWALASDPTSCPGDTWASWLPALEAPPAQEEDDDMRLLRATPSGRVFALGPAGKRWIDDNVEAGVYQAAGVGVTTITDDQAAAIPDIYGGLVIASPSGKVYVLGETGKRWIDDTAELAAYRAAGFTFTPVPDTWADNIPNAA